ncbi:MAG: nuclease-related domain-containing protein, partial [Candidatus Dormibacteraceae bacterium]
MARVLGKSGRYVSEQATKRLHSMWACGVYGVAAMGTVLGFFLRGSVPWLKLPPAGSVVLSGALLLALWLVAKVTFRRLDELEKERDRMRSGAEGERSVGRVLGRLPDDYRVIHDLATPTGNLD